MLFKDWKVNQEDNIEGYLGWKHKWQLKTGGVLYRLTLNEYMFKAYEAGLNNPNQIGRSIEQYNLSRINDEGDYTVNNCRFITKLENIREMKSISNSRRLLISKLMIGNTYNKGQIHSQGENHGKAKLTNEQVKSIFLDTRSLEEIVKDYPASNITIKRIKSRDRWSSVTAYL